MRAPLWLLLAVVGARPTQAAPVDLATNGSFEQTRDDLPDEWTCETWQGGATCDLDPQAPHSGAACLRFASASPDGEAVASQVVPLLQPSLPCRIEGWWHGEGLNGIGARVVCRFLDGGGQKLADAPPMEKAGDFAWERFSADLAPPEGTAAVQVFLELWKSAGQAWFDDVSITQDVQPLDYNDLRIGGGGEQGNLRVAILDVRPAGGRTYGAQGLYDHLAPAAGIDAELVSDPTLFELSRYDCVIAPEIQTEGALAGRRIRQANWQWLTDWRAALISYVRAGGGIVLLHDSVGFRFALEHPLFPEVVRGVEKSLNRQVARFSEHAVTQGLQPFQCAFEDTIALEAGESGQPVVFNADDQPVLVVGEAGGGRVVGCGLALGIDENSREAPPTGQEALLLEQAVRWSAGGARQPVALLLTPALASVREPDEPLASSLYAFPLLPQIRGTRLEVQASLMSAGEAIARRDVEVEAAEDELLPAAIQFSTNTLQDGAYPVAIEAPGGLLSSLDRPAVMAMADVRTDFVRFADGLPKSSFQWRACNVHGPGGLKTADEIEQMVRHVQEMQFTTLLIAGKPPNGRAYWDTEIGTRAPDFPDLDHLAVASEACERAGLECLVQFCTFVEGSAQDPSDFLKEHPEWAEYHEGQPQALAERGGDVFGCPDRPEVRDYELSLIREIVTKYPHVDGISFDYIRYGNDRWCDCERSKAMQAEFAQKHPELDEREMKAKFAEEQIVSFTWEVRKLLDEVRPGLILHGYCHPTWANRFPLNYLSFRASAHGDQPGRGGMWALERVLDAAKSNVELADDVVDFMKPAPMADTAYLQWAKSPERFRRELRLIYDAGARDIMVYPYSTLRGKPELRAMLAEEFGE
jgi:hypothetical protein